MSAGVLWLDEVGATDGQLVGGKAANLGELLRIGFPVPNGFVVSADAYSRFYQSLGLQANLARDASATEIAQECAAIRSTIEGADLTPELADAILSAHATLVAGHARKVLCAVRSSATAEDLGAASFAGQHGTYYYVDRENLLTKVKQCWASLWSPEAASYRATHGIDDASVSMAVVVQEMIPSEIAGVAFTANPVTGARDEVVIESSWGMGAAIVDGRVTPDHYVVARDGLKLRDKRIAEKRLMVSAHLEPGQHARLEQVPNEMRLKEALPPGMVDTIVEWSLKSEAHFGKPQDVEWAVCEGRFYILQSRPVTVMGREEIGAGLSGKHVLFKPIFENFTDPLTPLTQDLFEVYPMLSMRFVRGWLYMDISHLRRLLPFKVSDQDLAERMYSVSKEPPDWPLSLAKLPASLLAGFVFYLTAAVLFARSNSLPDDALDSHRATCRRMAQNESVSAEDTLPRLWMLPRLFAPVADLPLLLNLASFRFTLWMGILRRLVRRWAPEIRSDAETLLGSGTDGVLSAEMGRGIWALAQEARRSARVREIFLKQRPEQTLMTLKREPEARIFLARLDQFLAINGHRAIKEFELRSVRWEEDPSVVLGMVRNYVLVEAEPVVHEKKAAEARTEFLRELKAALMKLPFESALGFRLRMIRHAAERVRYFMKLRENTRFYHIMGPGTVRKKVLKIEAELMRDGKLKCKDDIFYMRFPEIAALQSGALKWLDVEDKIRERRIEHIRLSKMGPPKTIGIELKGKSAAPDLAVDVSQLRGQPASPGRFEGNARVILDPSIDASIEPGEILIAPYTDPAWTPLFLTAGAAVVEVGSYLSHAGTVAREFGMPCVVDVPGATLKIHTGDRISVDGERGSVRVLSGGAAT